MSLIASRLCHSGSHDGPVTRRANAAREGANTGHRVNTSHSCRLECAARTQRTVGGGWTGPALRVGKREQPARSTLSQTSQPTSMRNDSSHATAVLSAIHIAEQALTGVGPRCAFGRAGRQVLGRMRLAGCAQPPASSETNVTKLTEHACRFGRPGLAASGPREIDWQRDRAPRHAYRRRITMKIARVETLHRRTGAGGHGRSVRIGDPRHRPGRAGAMQRQPQPVGSPASVRDLPPARRAGPASGGALYWDMLRATRQNYAACPSGHGWHRSWRCGTSRPRRSGCRSMSCSAGPCVIGMRLYWSHCGTTRARMAAVLGTAPLRRTTTVGRPRARGRGRGSPRSRQHGDSRRPATVTPRLRQRDQHHRTAAAPGNAGRHRPLIGSPCRQAVGPKVGSAFRLNYNFERGCPAHRQLLEKYDMQGWRRQLGSRGAALQIKQSTSPAGLVREPGVGAAVPALLEKPRRGLAIIDVPWNGFSQSDTDGPAGRGVRRSTSRPTTTTATWPTFTRCILRLLPQRGIMEIDIDDVPLKGALVTKPPEIRDGHIWLTGRSRLGRRSQQKVLAEHPWPRRRRPPPPAFYGMDPTQMTAARKEGRGRQHIPWLLAGESRIRRGDGFN